MANPSDSFLALAKAPGRALVCAHEKPDGDALGSVCGLLEILRESGFEADAVISDGIPAMYEGFLPSEGVLRGVSKDDLKKYSRLFALDVSCRKRLSLGGLKYEDVDIPVLCLDHHPDNELPCPKWVDSTASSTAEMILRLVDLLGLKLSPGSASLVMLGMTTDTGCFRFDNSSPAAFRCAARLLEAGADFRRIVRDVYLTRPLNLSRLEADLLCNHLELAFDGRFAFFELSDEILAKHSVELKDTESLIDSIRSLKGVDLAAVIRPVEGGWKLSLRSKRAPFSAGRIARRLEGGGHEMAAGGLIRASSLAEAIETLKRNVEMELNEAQA